MKGLQFAVDFDILEPEVAQQSSNVIFNRVRLFLQKLACCQQCSAFLAGQCLDVHRPEQIDTHHLCNAAGIVAVALVDLGFEEGLGMTGFNADHRQSRLGQPAILNQFSSDSALLILKSPNGVTRKSCGQRNVSD